MAGELILVIEDDMVVSRLLTVLLEDAGYTVVVADAGDTGLAMARESRPACVLVDIGLPVLTGDLVLEQIKADPETAATPVIVVSAWGEHAMADRVRTLGAYDVLMKPFADEALIGLVSEALAGRGPAPAAEEA